MDFSVSDTYTFFFFGVVALFLPFWSSSLVSHGLYVDLGNLAQSGRLRDNLVCIISSAYSSPFELTSWSFRSSTFWE